MNATNKLIQEYYDAFNAADMTRFLNLLSDDIIHDINQSHREVGKDAFEKFMNKMNESYSEVLTNIVIMSTEDGSRAAAEFIVNGEYLKTDEGLPKASGQKYVLAAGAFFEIKENRISRVTNYYNLEDWVKQVSTN